MRETFIKLLYMLVVALSIAIEHAIFGERWKRYEIGRRAMGIATVMGAALGFALLSGVFDAETLLWALAAFFVAGAILFFDDQDRRARVARRSGAILSYDEDKTQDRERAS